MDVEEAIKGRRSIRKYKHTHVDDQKIARCLDAARWAPSADNSQPWEFIVVRDPETRKSLANIHKWGAHMADSPVVVAFLGDPRKDPKYYEEEVALTLQNFMLAAHSLGLGTSCIGVVNTEFEQPIRKMLGVPEGIVIFCTVSVGYPDEIVSSSRKPLKEMLHLERYGAKTQ